MEDHFCQKKNENEMLGMTKIEIFMICQNGIMASNDHNQKIRFVDVQGIILGILVHNNKHNEIIKSEVYN